MDKLYFTINRGLPSVSRFRSYTSFWQAVTGWGSSSGSFDKRSVACAEADVRMFRHISQCSRTTFKGINFDRGVESGLSEFAALLFRCGRATKAYDQRVWWTPRVSVEIHSPRHHRSADESPDFGLLQLECLSFRNIPLFASKAIYLTAYPLASFRKQPCRSRCRARMRDLGASFRGSKCFLSQSISGYTLWNRSFPLLRTADLTGPGVVSGRRRHQRERSLDALDDRKSE